MWGERRETGLVVLQGPCPPPPPGSVPGLGAFAPGEARYIPGFEWSNEFAGKDANGDPVREM